MTQEPETLYKLMVLYMLKKVNFPLTNSQLSAFFLDKEYTTYFTLQRIINDLLDAGLIEAHTVGNTTHYNISNDGMETLGFFSSDISSAAIADMDEYLRANRYSMRSETSVTADFYNPAAGVYIVQCEIREGRDKLFGMELSVPDEKVAASMCANWRECSQEIYAHVMMQLSGAGKE